MPAVPTRALITGGTAGIGAAFATELAARGTALVLLARDADRLAERAEELRRRFGVEVEVLPADLADRAQVTAVAERLAADPPIDLLVNNAGFGVRSRLLDEDVSGHDLAIDVMIRAVLVLAGTAGRVMRDRAAADGTRGQIINVSSTAGFITMGAYSAIKAWVTSYSEALANELHGTGVGVTALCPGWVRTEFHQRAGIDLALPKPAWVDVDELVRDCLRDAERGKVISIPTLRYRVAIGAARLAPRTAIRAVSRALSSHRH